VFVHCASDNRAPALRTIKRIEVDKWDVGPRSGGSGRARHDEPRTEDVRDEPRPAAQALTGLAPPGSLLRESDRRRAAVSAWRRPRGVWTSPTQLRATKSLIRASARDITSRGGRLLPSARQTATVRRRRAAIVPQHARTDVLLHHSLSGGRQVALEALWYNAVAVAATIDERWRPLLGRIRQASVDQFWNDETGRLADMVDVDHVAGNRDETLRPNQILTVGGLPVPLLTGPRAARVVDLLQAELLTPYGLRSLVPSDPAYVGRYAGDSAARDSAYHEGTVWPRLMGAFVDAWVRVRGNTRDARRHGRKCFLEPRSAQLRIAGLSHVSKITDSEAPFIARGRPFEAWSLGEYLRLDRVVLAEPVAVRVSDAQSVACARN
jgi:hypothetical protein